MRTGEWMEGEEFLILPDGRHSEEQTAARIRLVDADGSPAERVTAAEGTAGAQAAAGGRERKPGPDARREPAGGTGQITVAEVEQRAELRRTHPHPVLVIERPDGRPLCSVLPEQPGVPQPFSFRVEDERKELLHRIIRAPSRIGRRAYWRIEPADGSPPITGHRGTWLGWITFVVTFPIWLLFFVGSLLVTVFSLGEVTELLVWGAPKRITWRERWAPPLVGNALDFHYVRSGYRWNSDRLEARAAYAQAALHHFTKVHQN
jgi:hypothetical protein